MKYFKIDTGTIEKREITYDRALDIVLSCYRDNDMSRDMLTIPNNIIVSTGYIKVIKKSQWGDVCLMPGYWNNTPKGVEYDDEGKRILRSVQ